MFEKWQNAALKLPEKFCWAKGISQGTFDYLAECKASLQDNKKIGELDFVIETRDGDVMPIEVKSGKTYRRHRALDAALEVENWHLERGWVLGPGNVERVGKIVYLPVYMVSLFRNE